ncbi:WD repeat-containing protein 53 [Mortierella claussenii]|nr:WD repeat-containing protein 53 [Mortierella claussenii]
MGHVAPVLCLDNQHWMLASGSEDKTCRIWDIRTNKVYKALTGFESSVSTTSFTPADAHTIYVGSGDKIYTFDLRMESLLLDTTQSTRVYDGAEDEINQIQVNHRASYLTACDDAGDVRVLDLKSHKWMRQIKRQHDNIAMTVQFVPKKDLQALSGGMDKRVVAWDFYKGRATQLFDTDTPQDPNGVQSKQLFNPPFVHSIAIHPSGTHLAIGLGDGSIEFLHTATDPPTAPLLDTSENMGSATTSTFKKNKKKSSSSGGVQKDAWLSGSRLIEAHSSPIATLEYAGFNSNWLVTSSSNGTIAIWDDQATRYATMQKYERLLEEAQSMTESERKLYPHRGTVPPTAVGRAMQPLLEFRTTDVFERVNCITTNKSANSDPAIEGPVAQKKLFVAGTYPRTGDKQLQGRIAVYHL